VGRETLQMVVRYTPLSQSHELAAVERLCNTNEEATDTRTGASAQEPSDVEHPGPTEVFVFHSVKQLKGL